MTMRQIAIFKLCRRRVFSSSFLVDQLYQSVALSPNARTSIHSSRQAIHNVRFSFEFDFEQGPRERGDWKAWGTCMQ